MAGQLAAEGAKVEQVGIDPASCCQSAEQG